MPREIMLLFLRPNAAWRSLGVRVLSIAILRGREKAYSVSSFVHELRCFYQNNFEIYDFLHCYYDLQHLLKEMYSQAES